VLYLVHLDRPYRHARHYLGYVLGPHALEHRLHQHRTGQGARFLQVVTEAGIPFEVVRVWPEGTRDDERRLKLRGHLPDLCPRCRWRRNNYQRDWRARRRSWVNQAVPREEETSPGDEKTF
jgi:predicted GIY-YIG superfamily endonuclease